jgi:hypothetical protein
MRTSPRFALLFASLALLALPHCGPPDGIEPPPPPPPVDPVAHDMAMPPDLLKPLDLLQPDLLHVPSCQGTVTTTCSGHSGTVTLCTSIAGCTSTESTCAGFEHSCFSYSNQFSCDDQDGCYWLPASKYCSGSARRCADVSLSSCFLQDGCHEEYPICSGVPASCDTLHDSYACISQTGCEWK